MVKETNSRLWLTISKDTYKTLELLQKCFRGASKSEVVEKAITSFAIAYSQSVVELLKQDNDTKEEN